MDPSMQVRAVARILHMSFQVQGTKEWVALFKGLLQVLLADPTKLA